MPLDPRHRSHTLIDGPDRAPARSMLHSIGFDPEDLRRPLVMVVHSWIGTMPCNYTHRTLAQDVMRGVRAAGGTPMEVNTIAISDGVTMGTEGMKASLVSRELITDSIELAGMAYAFDAMVVIVGCDKTIPAGAMAAARLNIPSVILYSGSIAPGQLDGRDLTIQDVFEGVGSHAAGQISEEELTRIENAACPGAGSCGGQFTALHPVIWRDRRSPAFIVSGGSACATDASRAVLLPHRLRQIAGNSSSASQVLPLPRPIRATAGSNRS